MRLRNWTIFIEIIYVIILVLVCMLIIYDTRNTSKSLAYLLLAIFVPVVGMLFYFILGMNTRKHIIYSKKLIIDEKRLKELNKRIILSTQKNIKLNTDEISESKGLINLLLQDNLSTLTTGNEVNLLINSSCYLYNKLKYLKY